MSLICKDMEDIERLRISSKTKRNALDDLVIVRKELNWELDMLEEDIDYVSRIVSENESMCHALDVKIGRMSLNLGWRVTMVCRAQKRETSTRLRMLRHMLLSSYRTLC